MQELRAINRREVGAVGVLRFCSNAEMKDETTGGNTSNSTEVSYYYTVQQSNLLKFLEEVESTFWRCCVEQECDCEVGMVDQNMLEH